MHGGVLEFGVFAGNEADGFGEIVLAHGGLEVGGGLVFGFGVLAAPLDEEAVGQAAEHAEDPQAVGVANPAAIIV